MTYDYAARTAWLDGLDPDAMPSGYDLCTTHADGLGVPVGWDRMDRRAIDSPALFRRAAS
jgi:hypothetical protein